MQPGDELLQICSAAHSAAYSKHLAAVAAAAGPVSGRVSGTEAWSAAVERELLGTLRVLAWARTVGEGFQASPHNSAPKASLPTCLPGQLSACLAIDQLAAPSAAASLPYLFSLAFAPFLV